MELLIGVAEEFGWDGIIKDLQAYNWELLDVTIRCCTLREALNEIIDELIEEHRKGE
ncbi:MAG: hypothetical protein K6A74_09940 [Lachnospiraceae bacterium]|nr:hypothetical protein [Lachnospiraceae bacterium]